MQQPSKRAIEEARGVLNALASASQSYHLYPAGHPSRSDVLRDVVEHVNRLLAASDEVPVLFVARHSFYLGPALLARESLSFPKLIGMFEEAGIQAVELLPGLSQNDIDGLVRVLMGEQDSHVPLAGIAVNRVRPMLGGEDDHDRQMSELLLTYASGLEVVRQTAASVASGGDVDLEATTTWVEQLADDVARDPMQALMASTVKSYDDYTYYHMMNVCLLSMALGYAVGLQREQVVLLGIGGMLHDVGKVKVPREVLTYSGPLSEEGWRLIQRHPVDGAGLMFVTTRDLFHPAASIVLEHHSAFDLGGYPSLTKRPTPSLAARIVAVADSFDAVTSKRPYRQAEDRRQALTILHAASGRGYDPRVVRAFSRLLGLFPVGSLVRLSTGEMAMVVRNHPAMLARPIVQLLLDRSGTPTDPVEIDLADRGRDGEFLVSVEKTLNPDAMGLDMAVLLRTHRVEEARPEPAEAEPGLFHEPSYGEAAPENYVDTHAEEHGHEHPHVHYDPDVAPPMPDELPPPPDSGRSD